MVNQRQGVRTSLSLPLFVSGLCTYATYSPYYFIRTLYIYIYVCPYIYNIYIYIYIYIQMFQQRYIAVAYNNEGFVDQWLVKH